jgi:hypothetical protein
MPLFGPKVPPKTLSVTAPWSGQPAPRDAFLSGAYRSLHPVDVNFREAWQLAGLRFTEEEGRITLALRWRCLKREDRWLRCFGHLRNSQGETLACLDHDLLGGTPKPGEWAPGDEGFETRYMLVQPPPAGLRVELGPQGFEVQSPNGTDAGLRLHLGLFYPAPNLRLPVVRSTLPVTEEGTAVLVTPNAEPGREVQYRLEPRPLEPCEVSFEHGLALAGYSAAQGQGLVWLRLKWRVRERPGGNLRFFGHGVGAADAEAPSLASFDQDLHADRRSAGTEFEQDIVRAVPPAATLLRGGLCKSPGLERLGIRNSTLPFDAQARCFYLPLAGC